MIELLATIKELGNSGLNLTDINDKLSSFKEVGIPENQLNNLDKSLNENKEFKFSDAGVSKEVVPLNYDEASFNKLLNNGTFDDAPNKIFAVNQDFFKQPLDVINKIEDTVSASGGEIKSFDYSNPPIEKISCRNESLAGINHPETGVKFEQKIISTNDGFREVVVPEFNGIVDIKLPDEICKESDKKQFDYASKNLQENIAGSSELRSKFTEEQLEQISNGDTPDGYTWHHSEEVGMLQLVDSDIHNKTGHTGGKNIWGGGSAAR